MTPPAHDFAIRRFSLTDFAERDRVAAWRDLYGRLVLQAEVTPLPQQPLHADVTVQALPGLVITSAALSAFRYERSTELIADGNDGLALVTVSQDAKAVQRGREVTWKAGDALLMSSADPFAMVCTTPTHALCLHIPRSVFVLLVGSVDRAVMRPIPGSTEALKLLTSYVSALREDYALATPGLRHHVVAHLHDLIAVAVGATRDAAAVANERGIRAARLRAIKAEIIRCLGRGDLTVVAVAKRYGITPRQIQRLFESEGTTYSQFVLGQRLARAHRLLTNPHFADRAISAVAFEVGFGDLSYFNRAFRRHFSATPSEVRDGAQQQFMGGGRIVHGAKCSTLAG